LELIESVHLESKGCLVVNAQIRKVLEDLLKRRLADRVLLNGEAFLFSLNKSKQVPNGLVLFRHSEFKEVPALFNQFNLGEQFGEIFDELEAAGLRLQELDKVEQSDLPRLIQLTFLH